MPEIKVETLTRNCRCRYCRKDVKAKTRGVAFRGLWIKGANHIFLHLKCWEKMKASVEDSMEGTDRPGWFDGGVE